MPKNDLTFKVVDFVGEYLRSNPGKRLTAKQLAEEIVAAHPIEAEHKRVSSTQDLDHIGLVMQVWAQIGAARKGIEKKFPNVSVTADKPRLYFWRETEDLEMGDEEASLTSYKTSSPKENDLYPILRDYLRQERSIYSMRIDEKKSSGKGGSGSSHWLHPDLVGIQLLSEDWAKETQTLAKFYNPNLIKLWSFEVKTSLTMGNVRSSYFQAVSNSSWANFGYLVAETIDQRALDELEILTGAHGVGVMQLKAEDISESRVVIPAREQAELNWKSINRLAEENKDFAQFLKGLERLHQTGDIQLVGKQFETSFKI